MYPDARGGATINAYAHYRAAVALGELDLTVKSEALKQRCVSMGSPWPEAGDALVEEILAAQQRFLKK
jgi:hypothetical protein